MANSFRDMRKRSSEAERHRARHRAGGGAVEDDDAAEKRSDEAEDKAMIKAAVHKHEKRDHPGTKLTKLKKGGNVDGKHAKRNLGFARGGRAKLKTGGTVHPHPLGNLGKYAHGGRVKTRSKGVGATKKHVTNVIIAPQGGGNGPPPPRPMPMPPPMLGKPPMPPGAGASPPPGGAMPGAGPMPMPPPGAGGPPRPPMAARGGRIAAYKRGGTVKPQQISAKMEGGAGSGVGRLDKTRLYGA